MRKSPWKNPYLYSSLLVLFFFAYAGYVLLARHLSDRDIEKRAFDEQAEKRRQDDQRTIEQLGGSELAIRALYLSPPTVGPGQSAQLCYDVANAKTVTLQPPLAEVWPSHSRCIDLTVKKTTKFTLTIADSAGKIISETVELSVH